MRKKLASDVTIVETPKQARKVVNKLRKLRSELHATDVETTDIDLKVQGPYGNGRIICFSLYCGPNVDFGTGPKLWVDTDKNDATLYEFEDYFRDPGLRRCAHFASFDYAQFFNHGIRLGGTIVDTYHKARLYNPSRSGHKPYSLESLSASYLDRKKETIDQRFSQPLLKKDGTPSKQRYTPPLIDIQRNPKTRLSWIDYSTEDTALDWELDAVLTEKLLKISWTKGKTLLDFYNQEWLHLGRILRGMEERGIFLDADELIEVRPRAEQDFNEAQAAFKSWASERCPDAIHFNPNSDKQLQVMFFGGWQHPENPDLHLPEEHVFEIDNVTGWVDPTAPTHFKNGKPKPPKKKRPIRLRSLGLGVEPEDFTDGGMPQVNGAVLDRLAGDVKKKLWGTAYASVGKPGCKAIAALAKAGKISTALANFIIPLPSAVDKHGRIHPSMDLNTETGRLSMKRPNGQNQPSKDKGDPYFIRDAFQAHPTIPRWLLERMEAGLLYDFVVDRIKWELKHWGYVLMTLYVADFSQLELRLLAHMSNCKSMIEAFKHGGDYHSRTAVGMFPEVREAVESGKCVVIADDKGTPTVKDMFPFQRGRGKTINFSVAYGKTKYGFAKDWGTTEDEAERYLNLWFSDKPEVRDWQQAMIQKAYRTGVVRTLGGRIRPLAHFLRSASKGLRKAGERRVVNTPIQGGAADVCNRAMIRCDADEHITKLGYAPLLQIHDELLFEGLWYFAEDAGKSIVHNMSHPYEQPLRVDLEVSSSFAPSWYLAK